MEIVKLKARARTGTGKKYTGKLRRSGWVPAAYYGHNRQTKNIEVNSRELANLVRAKQTMHLIDLELPEENGDSIAVIKEIQRDCIKTTTLFFHVDFQHVAMNETISVNCPVQILGIPLGVREANGVLQNPMKVLLIECLPADIPEKITVDVTELKIGGSVHVRDISVPKVVLKDPPEAVIAACTHATEEEVKVEEVAVTAEGAVPAEGGAAAAAAGTPAAPGAAPEGAKTDGAAKKEAAPKKDASSKKAAKK
ncbi:MAG: 50S ribosomal protein L25 [Chitinivibrionales bacterium]|nr:50S ribosomal protein L25 [Chitinivibrionales bacterium]